MKARRKHAIIIAALLCLLAVLFVVVLFYLFPLLSLHINNIVESHEYTPHSIASYDEKYLLTTQKITEGETGTFATFIITDAETERVLFECPDRYRTIDLKFIDWDEDSYNIVVISGDVGTVRYSAEDWLIEIDTHSENKIQVADKLKYPIMTKAYTDSSYPCPVMINNEAEESRNWLSGTYDEMLLSLEDNVLYAPPILGDFDRDGVYETIYTASKWDAPHSMWFDILQTKEEFLQGIENLEKGLETNTGDYDIDVSELRASVHPEMPEYVFQERKREASEYVSACNRLNIISDDGELIANFDLLAYTLWGEPTYATDNVELVDFNFDGHKDILLRDKPNGNWNIHYIYFQWEPVHGTFIHTDAFEHLGLPTFDEEKQLVYSMWRGSASDHSYFTHQYIDGSLTIIERTTNTTARFVEGISDEQLAAVIPLILECERWVIQFERVESLNPDTMELEIASEKYQLFDVPFDWEFIAEYDADSDIGKALSELINWEWMEP